MDAFLAMPFDSAMQQAAGGRDLIWAGTLAAARGVRNAREPLAARRAPLVDELQAGTYGRSFHALDSELDAHEANLLARAASAVSAELAARDAAARTEAEAAAAARRGAFYAGGGRTRGPPLRLVAAPHDSIVLNAALASGIPGQRILPLPGGRAIAVVALPAGGGPAGGAGGGSYEALLALDSGNAVRAARPEALAALPRRRATAADQAEPCPICQARPAAGTPMAVLPCDHAFCADCLAPWLRRSATCPTCRAGLPEADTWLVPADGE